MNETTTPSPFVRKAFSRIGWAFCAILLITTALQALWILVPRLFWGENNWATDSSWGNWIGSFAPLYMVGIPVGLWILRKLPARTPEDHKMPWSSYWALVPICMFLMYTGSFVGTLLSLLLSGGTAENTVAELTSDTNPLKVVVMVILAPLLEEYLCRKQLIDRTRQYGEKTAVLLSALIFGLLHQNLYQFFYAFALGLVFGFLYLRTGRLRYTVFLHALFNFMGAVVAPWFLSLYTSEDLQNIPVTATTEELLELYRDILPELLLSLLYAMILFGCFIAGLILLITERKRLIWKESEEPLSRGTVFKTVYWNAGMVLFALLCLAAFVLVLL